MKKLILEYKYSLLISGLILILILLRSIGGNHFKNDAESFALMSLSNKNIIVTGEVENDDIIIDLDAFSDSDNLSDLLSAENLKQLRSTESLKILKSENIHLSSRIWMLLAQNGLENIRISLSSDSDEIFKYKFRPDTGMVIK